MNPRSVIALHYLFAALVGMTFGYFVGRAHQKYEMRSMVAQYQPDDSSIPAAQPAGGGGGLMYQVVETTSPSTAASQVEMPPRKPNAPQAFQVVLLRKGFHDHDVSKNELQDLITFGVSFENIEGKDIRAFEGVLTFCDLLDNHILSCSVAITRPVANGAKIDWNGQLNYIPFLDSHEKLRNENKMNLKVIFTPIKILFADGTTKQFEYSR